MTAIMMAAAGLTIPFSGVALDTTLSSVGDIAYDSTGGSEPDFAYLYGYKLNPSAHPIVTTSSSSGGLNDTTYTDGGSNSRTIVYIGWSDTGVGGTPAGETDNIYFGLDGNAIPNTDTTFVSIEYDGQTYTRASASSYTNPSSTESCWQWNDVTPNGPTAGTPTLIVNI
jgi:hypothetical protein